MGRWSEPPFVRGETYFNGNVLNTTDLTAIGGEILEGRHYVFEDTIHQSGSEVHVKVVRNMSATPVLPGQLLLPTTVGSYTGITFPAGATGLPDEPLTWAPGDFIGRVNGVCTTAASLVYIADELLPGGGVPQYDLFYVVVQGPVLVNLMYPSPAITPGTHIVSAATLGAATAQDLSGTTTPLGNQIQNYIGIALETLAAATSANTGGSATDAPYSPAPQFAVPGSVLINARNYW